jgi:hypothetical protein
MSKKIDLLQNAQEQREIQYSSIINNEKFAIPESPDLQRPRINKSVFIYSLVACFIFLFFVLLVRLLVINELSRVDTLINTKIGDIEGKIKWFNELAVGLNKDSEETNSRIKNVEIEQNRLKESLDVQKTAVDNLIKAKNSLFNRVSELEAAKGVSSK